MDQYSLIAAFLFEARIGEHVVAYYVLRVFFPFHFCSSFLQTNIIFLCWDFLDSTVVKLMAHIFLSFQVKMNAKFALAK